MADEITNTDIATAALEPAEISEDAGGMKNRPIPELIQAQKHTASQRAVSANPFFGLRMAKAAFGSAPGQ